MKRRALLLSLGAASSLAGCSALAPTGDGTPTGTPGGCTAPDGAPDVPLPARVTRESAVRFALRFEETVAARRATGRGWSVTGTDLADPPHVEEARNGYVVRAVVSLAATRPADSFADAPADADGEVTVSLPYSGWYRVTTDRAERAPVVGDRVPVSGWRTVACP